VTSTQQAPATFALYLQTRRIC